MRLPEITRITFSVAYLTLALLVAHCAAQETLTIPVTPLPVIEVPGLNVEVLPLQEAYGSQDAILIGVTFCNTLPHCLTMLEWGTPFDELLGDVFSIQGPGALPAAGSADVQYVGPRYERGSPAPNDYMVLGPGECARVVIDVASGYDIRLPGSYKIQLRTYVQQYGLTCTPEALATASDHAIAYIESNVVAVVLAAAREPRLVATLQITAPDCSPSQWADLTGLMKDAAATVLAAAGLLETSRDEDGPEAARYTTWFGRHTDDSTQANLYNLVNSNFQFLAGLITRGEIPIVCGCPNESGGYIAATGYKTIDGALRRVVFLCHTYWDLPVNSQGPTTERTKSGVLIHEYAHWAAVLDDLAYHQDTCKALARSDPEAATRNADSYMFFAQNFSRERMPLLAGWGNCNYVQVGYTKSHSPEGGEWCPAGTFLTRFGLYDVSTYGGGNSPFVGWAACCAPRGLEAIDPRRGRQAAWGQCSWYDIGSYKTYGSKGSVGSDGAWCPPGTYLTQLDLDGGTPSSLYPIVGKVKCCSMKATLPQNWGRSYTLHVGSSMSLIPSRQWCPEGTFLTGLEYVETDADSGGWEGPFVGTCTCAAPDR